MLPRFDQARSGIRILIAGLKSQNRWVSSSEIEHRTWFIEVVQQDNGMAGNERPGNCAQQFEPCPEIRSRLAGDGFLHFPLCGAPVWLTTEAGAPSWRSPSILRTKQDDGLILCIFGDSLERWFSRKGWQANTVEKLILSISQKFHTSWCLSPSSFIISWNKTLSSYYFIEPFKIEFNCVFLILSNG